MEESEETEHYHGPGQAVLHLRWVTIPKGTEPFEVDWGYWEMSFPGGAYQLQHIYDLLTPVSTKHR